MKSWLLLVLSLSVLSGCETYGVAGGEVPDRLEDCIQLQRQTHEQLAEQQDRLDALHERLEERTRIEKRLAGIEDRVREAVEGNSGHCADRLLPAAERSGAMNTPGKAVVGSVERFRLPELDVTADARMDTGATTSSIHAANIRAFERDGEDWLRFFLPFVEGPDGEQGMEVERPRERRARIIQATIDDPAVRPVVTLRVRIGHLVQRAEFTLADRGNLEFPILIGRNVLRDMMVVDVSLEHAMGDPISGGDAAGGSAQ